MKNILLACLLFSSVIYAQNEVGIISMKNGDKITFFDGSNSDESKIVSGMRASGFGPFVFDGTEAFYYDQAGEVIKLKNVDIERVDFNYDKISYVPTTHSKGQKKGYDLHRIIAMNQQYVLSFYTSTYGNFLYIHTAEGKLVEKRLGVFGRGPNGVYGKGNIKKLDKTLKKYFPDCEQLFSEMTRNTEILLNDDKQKYFGNIYFLVDLEKAQTGGEQEAMNIIGNIQCAE